MFFTKMHGLGNDFILVSENDVEQTNVDVYSLAKRLCDRRTGIGADGLIIACPSSSCDIKMRIINSDGSEAEMCGNGIRCFAVFAYDNKLVNTKSFSVETLAGTIRPQIISTGSTISTVCVDMGAADFSCKSIPVDYPEQEFISQKLTIEDRTFIISAAIVGVPHAVVITDSVLSNDDVVRYGRVIESHKLFPKHTNVNFVTVTSDSDITVRTFERGCGMTLACGTGSCASAVCCRKMGLCHGSPINVSLILGTLSVTFDSDYSRILMSGPAETVFCGQIII